jgi:multisubunit Na+/H+ antiporter MnhC subunit
VTEIGKMLLGLGLVIVAAGLVLLLLGKTNLLIGRLPGDILYRGKHTTFYFPLATSIVLSAVISVVLYVIGRIRH